MIQATADPLDRASELEEAERAAGAYAVRAQLAQPGATECEDCGDEIPEARRIAAPWAVMCVYCQEISER